MATNLDRLGRNLRESLNVIHDLRDRGIGTKSLTDPIPIDTTDDSAMAELAVALLALFAHMERSSRQNGPPTGTSLRADGARARLSDRQILTPSS